MLAITVSARSLHGLKFPDDLEALATSFGVPADKIAIEMPRVVGFASSQKRSAF